MAKLLERCGGAIADKGDQGAAAITPIKKQPGGELAASDRQVNTQLPTIRVAVEWAIAHLKNWRLLATRYRSDLTRIDTDIQAVAGLQKLNPAHTERRLTFDRTKAAKTVSG